MRAYVALKLLVTICVVTSGAYAQSDNSLRVYSYLTATFLDPVLEAFEAETGVRVSAEYMTANQLLDRLVAEKENPQADIVFTMEAMRLAKLVDADVLAPVVVDDLKAAIPEQYRHPAGLWFGLSKWTRTVFFAKDRVDVATLSSIKDLANPVWKGRICVRPSNKIYVQTMLAALIARSGEEATRSFVRGLVANLARDPVDLDLVQIDGIVDGVCDVAIANSYYYGRLIPQSRNPDVKRILDAVGIHYVDQDAQGAHMNVSGYAMVKGANNPNDARKLMSYMIRPAVQRLYADASMDHPIVSGLKPHRGLQSLGIFIEDDQPLHELGKHYELVEQISREEGWLWK